MNTSLEAGQRQIKKMIQQHDIDKRSEETLNSFEGMQRATPDPYFFTRLHARLQEKMPLWESISNILSRPAVAFATISFVLVLNAFAFLKQQSQNEVSAAPITSDVSEQNMTNVYDFATKTNNSLLKIWNTENEQVKK